MKDKLIHDLDELMRKTEGMTQDELKAKPDYFDFKSTKAHSEVIMLKNRKNEISKKLNSIASDLVCENMLPQGMLQSIENFKNIGLGDEGFNTAASEIMSQLQAIRLPDHEAREFKVCAPRNIPSEIKEDIVEDLKEMEACFSAGCYRACTILCGRVLETALHRRYYDATGVDLLEKSPGIGLGNLISKLKAKNISFDPGITQQIHLINQIRIFSVHKKQEKFYPTRPQTQAMILYTCDILSKLF